MLSRIFIIGIISAVGTPSVMLLCYRFLRRGLAVRLMLWLMPIIAYTAWSMIIWMHYGDIGNLKLTLSLLPLDAIVVGAGFVLVGRNIGERISASAEYLLQGAEQIESAANQVASCSQSIAQGASEQASSIQNMAEASGCLVAQVKQNEHSVRSVAEITRRTEVEFGETEQDLDIMLQKIDGIGTANDQIRKVLKMIDDIAFQTNILALNAAVEAARAGEAGMGFAVVADEVRGLAQRCAQAAKETSEMVDHSIAAAGTGKTTVYKVVNAVRSIALETASAGSLVESARAVSAEQTRKVGDISTSIDRLEHVTQSTAASAEQNAAAAEELSAQTRVIKQAVYSLQTLVNG